MDNAECHHPSLRCHHIYLYIYISISIYLIYIYIYIYIYKIYIYINNIYKNREREIFIYRSIDLYIYI